MENINQDGNGKEITRDDRNNTRTLRKYVSVEDDEKKMTTTTKKKWLWRKKGGWEEEDN